MGIFNFSKSEVKSQTLDRTKEIEAKNPRPLTEFVGQDINDSTSDLRQRAYRQRMVEDIASMTKKAES